MIQKVEFITQGFAEAVVKVTDKELQDYHAANKERYREPGNITFTHVFIDAERRSRDDARALAATKLTELKASSAVFSDAPRHGDRFPYGVNYVERSEDLVASHFGQQMAAQLFSLKPSDTTWQGPFESEYGVHLVMVVKRLETRDPPLKEVIRRVEADLVRDRRREQADKAIQSIVDGYEVELDLAGKAGKTLAQLNKTN